jgi:hypothetical protein
MTERKGRAAPLLLAALAAAACGGDNSLSGSVSEVFPLDVSRVEIARNAEAFQVTYFNNRGLFLDVVARVSVYVNDVEPDGGWRRPISLIGLTDGGVERCVVAHAPGGEPVRLLPPVKSGSLEVFSGGEPGQVASGRFSILFADQGGDLAANGRTLNGNFLGLAKDAGFGELP